MRMDLQQKIAELQEVTLCGPGAGPRAWRTVIRMLGQLLMDPFVFRIVCSRRAWSQVTPAAALIWKSSYPSTMFFKRQLFDIKRLFSVLFRSECTFVLMC